MNKNLTIKVPEKLDMFKAYLAAMNWTLGSNSLTEAEMEILAFLMYYNDIYKEITNDQVRSDLLLSNVVKKKIKEEFGVSATKLETYIGKLRKKGIITDTLNPKFMIYPTDSITLSYTFIHKSVQAPLPMYSPTESAPMQTTEEAPVYNTIPEQPVTNTTAAWTPTYED
jgi:hypothetical protein